MLMKSHYIHHSTALGKSPIFIAYTVQLELCEFNIL